jgi:hypothetical protein
MGMPAEMCEGGAISALQNREFEPEYCWSEREVKKHEMETILR